MSLAATVEIGSADIRRPVVIGVIALLAIALIAALLEQSAAGGLAPAGVAVLAVALPIGLILLAARLVGSIRSRRVTPGAGAKPHATGNDPAHSDPRAKLLQIAADGTVALDGRPALVVEARRLPGALYLRLRAARGRVDAAAADQGQSEQHTRSNWRPRHCLLASHRIDAAQWAALNRWVVWRRRGGGNVRTSHNVLG